MSIHWHTELAIKDIIGLAIALGTVAVGLWQYRRTSIRDFIKPLREAQLRLYEKASSLAAVLATAPRDTEQWTNARGEFLQLYYGPLAILEDIDRRDPNTLTVERAMVAFKDCLGRRRDEELEGLSLALAHACRRSLGRSWQVRVPQLEGDYQQIAIDYLNEMKGVKSGGAS